MRFLGLDIGTHRIGVAKADDTMFMALPVKTVDARQRARAIREISSIIADENVDVIVVGWPVDMNGNPGRASGRVKVFIDALTKNLDAQHVHVTVAWWDERLTTRAAENTLIQADISRKKRKDTVDQIAATYILQGYLDHSKHKLV